MLPIALIVAAEIALLVAIIVLREPKLLLLGVVVGLPIEYFGTRALSVLGESGTQGAIRALLNPGKAAMLATVAVVIVRERHNPRRLIPDSAVVFPVLLLLGFTVLGLYWADSHKPSNAVLILPMYVAFVFTAPTLIEDRRDLERLIGAFLITCIGLALIAIAQRPFGLYNWRTVLVASDGYSYRSNATFADPNHLARYMSLCIALAGGLILATGPRRTTLYLAVPTIVLSAAGIVVTGSRSGWMMMVIVTAMVVFAAPIARYTKVRLATAGGTAIVVLIILLLVQGGQNADRVRTLANPITALGQRDFLIHVGWQEFLDNPFIGVGTGNYQHALLTTYRDLIPSWAETTLSHTSIISILAEWGLLGLAMFAFVCFRVGVVVVKTYRASATPYVRLISGWLGASLVGIVLHSQSEGRLFDEPYIYLLLAMLVALETGDRFRRRAPEREVAAVAEAAAAREAIEVRLPQQPVGTPVLTPAMADDAEG